MAGLGKGLGKGLGALLSDTDIVNKNEKSNNGVLLININKIEPNKDQPRKYFDKELLDELADSIKSFGVVQPLIVKEENGFYSIIAGERRWRASKIAGLKEVPVIVKDYEKAEVLQIALIENIQRADLNPIEEALCYKKLMDDYLFTQEDISNKISKSRTNITTYLSLLKLNERVQDLLIENRLSVSIAKILLKVTDLDDQYFLANIMVDDDLSIKGANVLVERYLKYGLEEKEKIRPKKADYIINLEHELNKIFTTDVKIKNNDKNEKGKIEIGYASKEELDRLLLLFNKIN